jgi:shikimate dehydrogenase
MIKKFGLIGEKLDHSFSKIYFENKFNELNLKDHEYNLYPLKSINEFHQLLVSEPNLIGINVTIPFKEVVINYLDELDKEAKNINAVNCIKIINQNDNLKLKGFNTDAFGFRQSLKPFLESQHEKALLLGTGGAAKAVEYVLNTLGISVFSVTRNKTKENQFNYEELTADIMNHFKLIVNCTPVGMYPKTDEFPQIPYEAVQSDFLLYDLIYNPQETMFLKKGKEQGAVCINGSSMLYHQADEAWRIWNQD